MNKIAAIVLAGGKGKRMKAKNVNKVIFPLAHKPMILHTIDILRNLNINPIIVVVGFAKKSVMDLLSSKVLFAEQKKRLGTGHAVSIALKKLGKNVNDVLVLNGDDSAFYKKEIIANLIKKHGELDSSVTFLTIELDNPAGLGHVVRDNFGKVLAIVEDKDAIGKYREIKEVNPACYVFSIEFLKKYIAKIEKSKISNEYYLTSLIDIAIKNGKKVEAVSGGRIPWRGINTIDELRDAEKLFLERGSISE